MPKSLPPLIPFDTLWSLLESTQTPRCQAWISSKVKILWIRKIEFAEAPAGFMMLVAAPLTDVPAHYALMLPAEDRVEILKSLSSERQGRLSKQILTMMGALKSLHPFMLQQSVAAIMARSCFASADAGHRWLTVTAAGISVGGLTVGRHVTWWRVTNSQREYSWRATSANLKTVYGWTENS